MSTASDRRGQATRSFPRQARYSANAVAVLPLPDGPTTSSTEPWVRVIGSSYRGALTWQRVAGPPSVTLRAAEGSCRNRRAPHDARRLRQDSSADLRMTPLAPENAGKD